MEERERERKKERERKREIFIHFLEVTTSAPVRRAWLIDFERQRMSELQRDEAGRGRVQW